MYQEKENNIKNILSKFKILKNSSKFILISIIYNFILIHMAYFARSLSYLFMRVFFLLIFFKITVYPAAYINY